VVRSYGANIRSTASNSLFAVGRATGIVFNLLVANWLTNARVFQYGVMVVVIFIAVSYLCALLFTANNYNVDMAYMENE